MVFPLVKADAAEVAFHKVKISKSRIRHDRSPTFATTSYQERSQDLYIICPSI